MLVTDSEAVNHSGSISAMWWLVFTAVDLHFGVIIIDVLARSDSITEEKRKHLQTAKKVTLGLIALTV